MPIGVIFQSPTLEGFAAEIDWAQDPTGLRLNGTMPLSGKIEDEAYAADARDLVRKLPSSITRASPDQSGPYTVFVTGATGFLGSYVVRELLQQNMRVIAHVRSQDSAAGRARIENTTRAYGLWSDDWSSRLEVVTGDISKEKLGLSPDD